LNLFLVLFTTLGTAISIWQARIAQRSSAAAEKGADAAQQSSDTSDKAVLLAKKSEREARKSSEDQGRQSEKALKATIDNFHLEQRAWVSPAGIRKTPNEVIEIRFKNTGRTPAIRQISARGQTTDITTIPNVDKEPVGAPRANNAPDGTKLMQIPLDAGSIQTFASKQRGVFIYGTVFYNDVFRESHWTQWCYEMITTPNSVEFETCPTHNDSDVAHPPEKR
jgi:hypothetical protein